jgi:hypothetical protein
VFGDPWFGIVLVADLYLLILLGSIVFSFFLGASGIYRVISEFVNLFLHAEKIIIRGKSGEMKN